jgi:hypothetical protein
VSTVNLKWIGTYVNNKLEEEIGKETGIEIIGIEIIGIELIGMQLADS